MTLYHKFWFWYHTEIGLKSCSIYEVAHHINRAEYHENKIKGNK